MRQPTLRAWYFDVGPRLERGVRPRWWSMMTDLILPAMLLLCALAIPCGLLIVRARRNQTRLLIQLAAEQRTRDEAKCQAIEADLQEWLKTLELPALEEQTRLAAAARRLRIVLVERLVSGPRIR